MQTDRTTPGGSEPTDEARVAGAGGAPSVGEILRRGVRRVLPPSGTIEEAVKRVFAPHLGEDGEAPLWRQWQGTVRMLRPLGKVSRGNSVCLMSDGDDVFEAMWSAIEGAQRRVFFTTYILVDDRVGRRFRDLLAAAAERGVEVSLVLDSYGSGDLTEAFLEPLKEAGSDVVWFNPMLRFRTRFSRLVRNHRKILVVDEAIAFCGGMNASEDYAGERHGNGVFRDAHLALRGPCARDLGDLHRATILQMRSKPPARFKRPENQAEDLLVEVLQSNIRRDQRAIQKALHLTVVRAVERCYLTSPYFVPPAKLLRDLADAAKRGVDVRILTAGVSDVPAVTLASHHLYGKLLRAGVRIFEMQSRTLHAKTATIDGLFATVGSFNLDFISFRRNLEVTVATLDPRTAMEVEELFLADLGLSEEVFLESWKKRGTWERFRDWVAYRLLSL
ncbi:MAG: cardiolipin synthase [Planctomycetota bacterium]|jgi:cardiolipin synthase